jgi:hypothetical protein
VSEFLVAEETLVPSDAAGPSPSLLVGGAVVLVASVLLLLAGQLLLSADPRYALGYVLAAVGAPVLVGLHRQHVERARGEADGLFVVPHWVLQAQVALIVGGIATGLVHAWLLATELAS